MTPIDRTQAISDVPQSRDEMLEDLAETARLARAKGQHGTALAAQVKIAELMGFMQAPPRRTSRKKALRREPTLLEAADAIAKTVEAER